MLGFWQVLLFWLYQSEEHAALPPAESDPPPSPSITGQCCLLRLAGGLRGLRQKGVFHLWESHPRNTIQLWSLILIMEIKIVYLNFFFFIITIKVLDSPFSCQPFFKIWYSNFCRMCEHCGGGKARLRKQRSEAICSNKGLRQRGCGNSWGLYFVFFVICTFSNTSLK